MSFSSIKQLELHSRGWEGETLLLMVCLQGIVEDVEILIAAGADVNATEDFGNTPLHRAVGARDAVKALQIVRLLLAAGADPNVENEWKSTPLYKAHQRGLREIEWELQEAGARA